MKERLTGAIILVVVVVLLVPELLSGPSRSLPQAPPTLPTTASSEEAPLRSYTINLQDDAHAAGAGTASTPAPSSGPAQPTPIAESSNPDSAQPQAATADSPADSDASASTDTPSVTTPPPSENPAPPPQTVAPPASPLGISSLTARSQHSPPPAAAQRSVSPEKPAPAQQQHFAAAGPAERHPVEHSSVSEHSEPAGTAGGWMVQLGVFSVQANAERLAQELKSQGFHSLVSQIGSAGRPLWRVRAGPVAEHAAAEQLSARLRAAGHAGSVVPTRDSLAGRSVVPK